jgi:peptide/nickel transport system substrate-binding protein
VFKLNTPSETKLSELIISQVNIAGPEWDELTEAQKNDWHYACGTGPFILTDFVPDNHFTFVKNENYYDYDERYPENKLPYLDGLVLQKFSDSTSLISSFISGNLDFTGSNAGLSASEKKQLENDTEGVRTVYFPYSAPGIGLKVNHEPFSDVKVRIAMQKAINMEEVTKSYYGYDEVQPVGLWSQLIPGFSAVDEWDDELKGEYGYDPEAAKKLLAEAGYADGFKFTVAIDPMGEIDVYQLAKGYLAEVGIEMEIEVLSDMMQGREVQGNPDDARGFNFGAGSSIDPGFAFQTFATTGFAYNTFHGDTHMDDLLVAARDAMTLTEQQEAAREVDLYYAKQHWIIVLSGLTRQPEFVSERVGGLNNGEMLEASHFYKTITARVWAQ